MDDRRIDLNSADLATLLRETSLDIRKAEVLVNARPFWGDAELRMLPGFGRKTLRDLAAVSRVVLPAPVNINVCSPEVLQALPGLGAVLVQRLIIGRPYASLDELAEVPGISRSVMQMLRLRADVTERQQDDNFTAVSLDGDIHDLNSCDEDALSGLPGIGPVVAGRIVAARPFLHVDDLLEVKGIGPAILSPLHTRLIVRSPNDARHLLDVNECSMQALQRLPGLGPALAIRVVSGRPYSHWDELLDIKGVGPELLLRLRQACEPLSMRSEAVEAEFVEDDIWHTEVDFSTTMFEPAPGLPQVRDPVMSLVAYQAAVEQEIRRRMPLFLSGWVVAVALIIGMLVLYFSGSLQVG
jgi:competence protein ComEA